MRQKGNYHKIFVLLFIFACGPASWYWAGSRSGAATAVDGILPQSVMIVNVKSHNAVSKIETLNVANTVHYPVRKSAPPVPNSGKPRLVIHDKNGNSLYETEFSYPSIRTVPPPLSGVADGVPATLPVDSPEVALVVPSLPNARNIVVFDAGNEAASSVKPAAEAKPVAESGLKASVVGAAAQAGELNILIIANGYNSSNMDSFQTTAAGIKSMLANAEPFSSYPNQVKINIYGNTTDLGCSADYDGIPRLMNCSASKVISAAVSSHYPFDKIIVVDNTSTYSGGGYRGANYKASNFYNSYSMVYDGPYSAVMALHEFGHAFGDLCDEYYDSSESNVAYTSCVNCRASCADWSACSDACQTDGCDVMPSYHRPENSIMYDIRYYTTFNQASIGATYSPDGLLKRLQYFVGAPLAAAFNKSAASGKIPLAVRFTDSSTGIIKTWRWDFGDGKSSTLESPIHIYTQAGDHPVTLTVTGPGGTSTSNPQHIVVYAAPTANFTAVPGAAALSVNFTDNSTGVVNSRLWQFGDGITITSKDVMNPSHTYKRVGAYIARLTVTGPGGTGTKALLIRVTK
jgi:PKD repeat protein